MTAPPLDRFWFGADYNPEQWPREVWLEDVALMREAGVTVVSVGIFAWAQLEPRNGEFDFAWLDAVLELLHENGIGVDLATATASPPPWMSHQHPDILPVTVDGVTLSPGSRQHFSPTSATYRRYAARLVTALATRYGRHPAVVAWHVGNEFANHVVVSYDDEAAEAFRRWLAARYGSIEALNHAWGTTFWSQRYDTFAEVLPPRAMPTFPNPTQALDWRRFASDAQLELYRAEAEILRRLSPGIPITTNFMGFFGELDYWRWAAEVDFVSDDCYPDPADARSPELAAAARDLMRSLAGDKPWLVMEQATSAVNWRPRNGAKPPGLNRVHSLQAVTRGARGAMYFQWRQSRAGAEKFHSAIVPHAGPDSRVFRETAALGRELPGVDAAVAATPWSARIAIVLDWPSWWALEQTGLLTRLDYLESLRGWYRSAFERGIPVDFVPATGPFDAYAVVIAPCLHVVDAAAATALAAFAHGGGHLVVTYQSAVLDENLHVPAEGYLGALQPVLGVRVEEFAPLVGANSELRAPVVGATGFDASVPPPVSLAGSIAGDALLWAEYLHLDGATAESTFTHAPLDGGPAITRHDAGDGVAWYVATELADDPRGALLERVLAEAGVDAGELRPGSGLEHVRRGDVDVVLNHTGAERPLPPALAERLGVASLGPWDAVVR